MAAPRRLLSSVSSPDNSGFIVEYLVASCGFSHTEATRASKRINRMNSSKNPDAVIRFLEGLGFNRHQIKTIIRWNPNVLNFNIEKTLKTKIQIIRDLGFSSPEIVELIAANPYVLRVASIAPKIEFFRSHLPLKEDLLKALKRDATLLQCNLEETIIPNYALLRDCGVPDDRISKALFGMSWLLSRKASSFKELVDQTASLGLDCRSGMFLHGMNAINRCCKEKLEAKRLFMKSFGWSDDDFVSAFQKAPSFLARSEEKLGASMKFLLQEGGCEAGYIAAHPNLLTYSLERRLEPRIRARQLLKAEGLPGGEKTLLTIAVMTDEKFWDGHVLSHINKIPALKEIYQAARAKNVERDAIA